ncbi:MAG: hypothetical protein GIW95_08030 [Candidatus Eremiobacteraeota bacterium]|nr:hypothetical protein [Candidatus Eremiobacteraeota bacterium]
MPKPVDKRARIAGFFSVLFVVAVAAAMLFTIDRSPLRAIAAGDFPGLYCAGKLMAGGADPYAAAPLEACEHVSAWDPLELPRGPGEVRPATIPPYVAALFVPLSFLSFERAAALWFAIVFAALAGSLLALRRATGLSWLVLCGSIAATAAYAGAAFGSLAPIALLGVAWSAALLKNERPKSAALAALLSLAQPLVGIPLLLALAVWSGRARLSALLGLAVVTAASAVLVPSALNAEFFSRVAVTQAAADLAAPGQLGATWLLYVLGNSEFAALAIASLQYFVWAVLAIALAGAVAKRLDTQAALVAFPAAFLTIGGPDLWPGGLALALPFAVVACARPGVLRPMAWIALGLLAVPWFAPATGGMLALGALGVALIAFGATAGSAMPFRSLVATAAVLAALAATGGIGRVPTTALRAFPARDTFAAQGFAPALAATQYGFTVRAKKAAPLDRRALAVRIPDWTALFMLGIFGLAVLVPRRTPRSPATPIYGLR